MNLKSNKAASTEAVFSFCRRMNAYVSLPLGEGGPLAVDEAKN